MKNSKYTREFRDSSVQLVLNSQESTTKIAKDLDVNEKTLYNWVREYKKANNIPIFQEAMLVPNLRNIALLKSQQKKRISVCVQRINFSSKSVTY